MSDAERTTQILSYADTAAVIVALFAERKRQYEKWGEQNHDDLVWYAILGEEFGEIGKALIEGPTEDIEAEVTHVCAVAFQWREAIERAKVG